MIKRKNIVTVRFIQFIYVMWLVTKSRCRVWQDDKLFSVADPGCLSRILIFLHPGSQIIKTATKEKGEKFVVLPWSYKNHKIETYFIFEVAKKKIWANLQRIIELFTQKIAIKHSEIWFGIRDPEKAYSVCRMPDVGSWIRTNGIGKGVLGRPATRQEVSSSAELWAAPPPSQYLWGG